VTHYVLCLLGQVTASSLWSCLRHESMQKLHNSQTTRLLKNLRASPVAVCRERPSVVVV